LKKRAYNAKQRMHLITKHFSCLLITLLLGGLPSIAQAGYFDVTYSGGRVQKVSRDGPHPNQSYVTSTSNGVKRRGGGSSGEPLPLPDGPTTASVTCTGSIKVTFTWVPDFPGEPAPKSAVLWEHSTASYSGDGGACANGLGHPFVPSDPANPNRGGTSQGFLQTVVTIPTGGGFTKTVTPSASSTKTLPHTWQAKACTADVSYAATLAPAVLTEVGALQDGATWKSLIGQQLQISGSCVGVNPLDGSSYSFPLSNFSWSLPIPNPVSTVIQPADNSFRSLIFCNVAAWNVNDIEFFALEKTTASTSKVSAQFVAQLISGPSSMGASHLLTVLSPVSNLFAGVGGFAGGTQNGVYSAMNTNFNYPPDPTAAVGAYFGTFVRDSSEYPAANGYHFYAQLILPGSTTYALPGTSLFPEGLDNSYPYAPWNPYSWVTLPFASSSLDFQYTDDSPAITVPYPELKTQIGMNLSFKMFDVFRPIFCEGMSVADVPLKVTNWSWHGRITRSSILDLFTFPGDDVQILSTGATDPFALQWTQVTNNGGQ
jgi:hypothetical protein